VLSAEHLLRFPRLDLLREIVQRARVLVADRLAGFDPFAEDGQVVEPSLEGVSELAIFFEAPAALEQLLRRGLILPEIRSGDALFYPCQFIRGTRGVKDSSAGQRRGAPGPDVCEAARLGEGP
jgi:hypothetical protein